RRGGRGRGRARPERQPTRRHGGRGQVDGDDDGADASEEGRHPDHLGAADGLGHHRLVGPGHRDPGAVAAVGRTLRPRL
ncbi:MAG: hypothetical protein M1832_000436, partial [Thelocarpon impressellum]